MGHGIAQVSATAGYNVVLRDIKQEFLDKAMGKIKWSLDKLVSKEKITQSESDDIYSRIKPIVDLKDAVKECDLVIEAVPEYPETLAVCRYDIPGTCRISAGPLPARLERKRSC